MLNREPLEPRLRRYLDERAIDRSPIGLEDRILRSVSDQPGRLPALPWPRELIAAAVIVALGLGVAAGIAYLHRQSAPMPGGPQGLTPVEQAELAQLEARPLVDLPPPAADGSCPVGPTSTIQPYRAAAGTVEVDGAGPVYGQGGAEIDTAKATYHDVTIFTDPTVRGVVLIRARQIGGSRIVVSSGPYARGPVLGTDTINGQVVELRSEEVLPAARPPADPIAAPGWGIWEIRQGMPRGSSGCNMVQMDTTAGTEIILPGAYPTR